MITVMVPHTTYRHYNLTDAEVMVIRDALARNNKVFAIKFMRASRQDDGALSSHFGLKEAKDLVDTFEKQDSQLQEQKAVQVSVLRAA